MSEIVQGCDDDNTMTIASEQFPEPFIGLSLFHIRNVFNGTAEILVPTPNLRQQLATFYHQNVGRPLSRTLMGVLLGTLGQFVEIPRTLKGLIPKRRCPHRDSIRQVTVCASCNIFRFDDLTIFNSVCCDQCSQRKLKCGNLRCEAVCILRGTTAVRMYCETCGIGPGFPKSKSAYHIMSFHDLLTTLFASKNNALDLLEPFHEAGILSMDGEHLPRFNSSISDNS
jgi:hypothetical protein